MSDNSTPDRDWLDERYPKDVASPAHLDNAIRTAAHDAVKRPYAAWYGFGAAASVVLAVVLTFFTLDTSREEFAPPAPQLESAAPMEGSASADADAAARSEERTLRRMAMERSAEKAAPEPAMLDAMSAPPREEEFMEEVVVQGARISIEGAGATAGEATAAMAAPGARLPDCAAAPEPDAFTYCLTDAGEIGVLYPGDHGCPALLPIVLDGDPVDTSIELIGEEPTTIRVAGSEFTCSDGRWLEQAD